MLLAQTINNDSPSKEALLCIIPYQTSESAMPVPISKLQETVSSVFYIGPKEAVTVRQDGYAYIIEPIIPAILYLTPDTNERPGLQAARIRVQVETAGKFIVQYSKERSADCEWINWNPLEALR